jgi:GTPase SAR1 family protein
MMRLNISKGHAFIMVYSVSSRQSLKELSSIWDAIVENKQGQMQDIPVMLVG